MNNAPQHPLGYQISMGDSQSAEDDSVCGVEHAATSSVSPALFDSGTEDAEEDTNKARWQLYVLACFLIGPWVLLKKPTPEIPVPRGCQLIFTLCAYAFAWVLVIGAALYLFFANQPDGILRDGLLMSAGPVSDINNICIYLLVAVCMLASTCGGGLGLFLFLAIFIARAHVLAPLIVYAVAAGIAMGISYLPALNKGEGQIGMFDVKE